MPVIDNMRFVCFVPSTRIVWGMNLTQLHRGPAVSSDVNKVKRFTTLIGVIMKQVVRSIRTIDPLDSKALLFRIQGFSRGLINDLGFKVRVMLQVLALEGHRRSLHHQ